MERIGRRTILAMWLLAVIALAGTLAAYVTNGPGCEAQERVAIGNVISIRGCP